MEHIWVGAGDQELCKGGEDVQGQFREEPFPLSSTLEETILCKCLA